MLRRLFSRNVAMLIGVVLAGQLLAGLLVQIWVIGPQTTRVADVTADMIHALSTTVGNLPAERRAAVIADLSDGSHLLIRPVSDPPTDGQRFPTFIEYRFMRALAARLTTQHKLDWITDTRGRLWIRLALGPDDYWVSVTPPRRRSAMTSLLAALAAAFLVATIAGLFLQRRLDRPLRRLAASVDAYDPERLSPPVATDGPAEVAAVATAFNRLTQRLARNDADRALMLGGVSHDLRTPLTRLRLSLEMIRGDEELRNVAVRQVDRIEAMLGQFLDFARGFESEAIVRTDLAPLLRQVVADCGATDSATLSLGDNIVIRTRPHALARAVANLLGNALRHGAAPISLTARIEGDRLGIMVRDAGPGLSTEQADAMLRPFARGDSARGGDGAGLGLAIADRAVRAIGGRLHFARDSEGFAVMIDLPLAIDN